MRRRQLSLHPNLSARALSLRCGVIVRAGRGADVCMGGRLGEIRVNRPGAVTGPHTSNIFHNIRKFEAASEPGLCIFCADVFAGVQSRRIYLSWGCRLLLLRTLPKNMPDCA
eukprot:357270-Chlamydomonas_euryale.AAC.9